jgi:hypothetical protein
MGYGSFPVSWVPLPFGWGSERERRRSSFTSFPTALLHRWRGLMG